MEKIVSVIVPAYNEEKRIENTLRALKTIDQIQHIYVVDDGSVDHTYENASTVDGVHVIKLPSNKGKGYALYEGVRAAIKNSDIILFIDADLEKTAKEAQKLILPILENKTDVTIGKFPSAKRKGGFGFVKKLARNGVYINTGVKLDTVLSGQRGFKKEVLEEVNQVYTGYGVELGMTIDILNKGYKITEVEVNMYHNETGRDLAGFLHRGKQFWQIFKVLVPKTISTKVRRR